MNETDEEEYDFVRVHCTSQCSLWVLCSGEISARNTRCLAQCVAEGELACGKEKGTDQRGGKPTVLIHFGELLVHRPHEFGLLNDVDVAAHQFAKTNRRL